MCNVTLNQDSWSTLHRVTFKILLEEEAKWMRQIATSIECDMHYCTQAPSGVWVLHVTTARRWFLELSKLPMCGEYHDLDEVRKVLLAILIEEGVPVC